MPGHYAFIIGSKGYLHLVSKESTFGESLDEYYNDSDISKISCVAVGPNNRYAVITSGGGAIYRAPKTFQDKMDEIKCSEIKHISFGYGDQWAITMKNGWCHCRLFKDALNRVNAENGNISYVSLGPRECDWIVGYGHNGYQTGGGLHNSLTSFLSGIHASKKKILLVEIGTNNNYFVDHEEGYYFNVPTDASKWFKNRPHPLASVSLW